MVECNLFITNSNAVASGDEPSSEKRSTVERTVAGNTITTGSGAEITLTANHNFLTGESVVVLADDGRTPDGIKRGKKYFIILGSADNKIKLANTLNDAFRGDAITIDNKLGGVLSVISRVTDKLPGDIGHPVQFDTTKSNWYILSSATTTTNKIHEGIVGFSTEIEANNSATYVQRISESRALDDRIYRLRYVIPKEFSATIAKKPEKNYTLQESRTVNEERVLSSSNVITNRNPKIISGISSTGTTVTVTSDLPHKLSVNDVVRVKNVTSSTNTGALDNVGFNGIFTVTGTPSPKVSHIQTQILVELLQIIYVLYVLVMRQDQIYQHLKERSMIQHIQYKKLKLFKTMFLVNKMVSTT